MLRMTQTALGTLVLIGATASGAAYAQTADSDAKIAALEHQLATMQQELHKLEKTEASRPPAYMPTKAPGGNSSVVVTMPNNRPTFCTADNLNCVAITSRLQFDAGLYDYRPNSASTTPQLAQNGVNARRARIGVLGTFSGDWDYGLIYELGGTQDNTAALENAYLTYKGIKNLYIEGGYLDVAYTLDESTSSNNITFLERATPAVVATNIAAGDNRSAFGARSMGDWWWLGSYVTGPASGFNHSTRPQTGAVVRGVVIPVNNQYSSLMLGAEAQFLFDTGGAPGTNTLATLNDRIEVRIDPGTNSLLNTGSLLNVSGARVFSGEFAGQIGGFYAQGEYFDYSVQRFGLSDLNFKGGYAQASYVLTGEQRKYSAANASYGGINPKNPVHWGTGGYGAWEIAARYSQLDLNDQIVLGGELRNTTVGVNWYVNSNVRFMFDWIHGNVAKNTVAGTDIGAHYDVYAMRTQVAF
jgi:phosphate-selective porin OprO/OprP